jgi:putative phosphoesterase
VRIGLLSDTHGFLDEAVFTHFADCDEVWHAGDFGMLEVLTRLREFKPMRGVFGNVDGPELRAEVPLDLAWECEGLRIYMTHIGGHPGRYDAKAKKELVARQPDVFICGHSHILRAVKDPSLELLYLNPGACGHQGWHTMRTMLKLTVNGGQLSSIEPIELGPRGRNSRPSGRPELS